VRDRSAAWRNRAFRSLPFPGDGHLTALQFGGFSARAALFVRRKPLRQRAPRAGS